MVCATLLTRYDMINFQMLLLEVFTASSAMPALFSVETLTVGKRVVTTDATNIGSFWNVLSVNNVTKQALSLFDAFYDQLRSLL